MRDYPELKCKMLSKNNKIYIDVHLKLKNFSIYSNWTKNF